MQDELDKTLIELNEDKSVNEEDGLSEEYKKVIIQRHKEDIADKKQDRRIRSILGDNIYTFVSLYMFAVFFILMMCGMPCSFHLSDTVLITLLGTTTANVIGVLMVVATYYFYRNKK